MIEPDASAFPYTGTALLVIDMQVGLFGADTPRHDTEGIVGRINELARAVRRAGGVVVFVQHDGPPGDVFEPGAGRLAAPSGAGAAPCRPRRAQARV